MARNRRTPEQIIRLLKPVDVLIAQGKSIEKSCRELGVADALYYKWCKEYGGMQVDQARRLKDLEAANKRLNPDSAVEE